MNEKVKELNEQLKPYYAGISASSLNWFDVSPFYFRKKLDGEIEEVDTKATELGNQLHMYLLEPHKFNDAYLYLNFDKPRSENQKEFCEICSQIKASDLTMKATDVAIPAYKKIYNTTKKSEEKIKEDALDLYLKLEPYIKYLLERDKYRGIIAHSTLSYLREARTRVNKHDKASELLFDEYDDMFDTPNVFSANELRIYWEHPELKVNDEPLVLKSIVDRLHIDHNTKVIRLIDVKTSGKLYIFGQKFEDYNYKRQMAFYWYAVEYLFNKLFPDKNINDYSKETYIVGIQTPDVMRKLPTECKVIKVEKDTLAKGKLEVDGALSEIIWHMDNDEWEHTLAYYNNNGIDLIV